MNSIYLVCTAALMIAGAGFAQTVPAVKRMEATAARTEAICAAEAVADEISAEDFAALIRRQAGWTTSNQQTLIAWHRACDAKVQGTRQGSRL